MARDYSCCPICGSFVAFDDLRYKVFNCHACGFFHWYEDESLGVAIERYHSELDDEEVQK